MARFGLQIPNFTFAGVPDDGMFERVADRGHELRQL